MSEVTVQEIEEAVSGADSEKDLRPEVLDPKEWIVNSGKLLPVDDISIFTDQQASYDLNEATARVKTLREELEELEREQNIAANSNFGPRDITYVDPYSEKIEKVKADIETCELMQAQSIARLREHRMVFTLKGMGAKWVKVMSKKNDKRTADRMKALIREHAAELNAKPDMSNEDESIMRADHKEARDELEYEGQMYWYYTLLSKAIVKIAVPYENRVLNEVNYTPEQVRELLEEFPESQEVRLINAVNKIMHTSQIVDPLVDAGFPG